MSTYDWPAAWALTRCSIYLKPNTREFRSPYGGAYQGIDLLGERFVMTGCLPPALRVDSGAREAFFNRLRGVHFIRAWHFGRPYPVGTQRATPRLSAAVAQGASSFPMENLTNGATWLAGDMFGIGGQLFQVAANVTVSGTTATVTTTNRARAALSDEAAVTWDKPTAEWVLTSPVAVLHQGGRVIDETEFELEQVW